ncbi:MAG: uroporphyrinogen decarboxylase family protein [Eubacteriales bacterium]
MHDMTSRERVMTALSHKETDIIPFSLGFGVNYPALASLKEYLGHSDIQQTAAMLNSCSDIRHVSPRYIGPPERNVTHPDGSYTDTWGVTRSPKHNARDFYMEISRYPLADVTYISELDDFLWPNPDWFDYSEIRRQLDSLAKDGEYAVMCGGGNIFEASWYMRGFENMLANLITEKELAGQILTRVTDYFIEYNRRCLDAADGRADITFTADDLGSQEGLLMTLPLWEEMIKPHHKRMNKVLHGYGVKIMYHTDGAVMKAVEGLLDMGIDILEALQFDAKGMDPAVLKRQTGGRLCYQGGVSVQSTLPIGTPGQVEEEVRERIRVLGKDGGYILAPSHAVQAGTPPENIVALLKAAGRI